MFREGMTQHMRVPRLCDSLLARALRYDTLYVAPPESSSARRDEACGLVGRRPFAALLEPIRERRFCRGSNGNDTHLPAFADDTHCTVAGQIDQVNRADFGEPQTRGVNEFEKG